MRITYIVAEAQLGFTLRRAAARLAETAPGLNVSLQGYTLDELTAIPFSRLQSDLLETDVLIGSMLNSDAETALLARALKSERPPVTLFFTCQPELTALSRIGSFDAEPLFRDRRALTALLEKLQSLGGPPLPPAAHVLLAAAPRFARHVGPEQLGDLWLYAQAGSYWLNASPENFARLLLFLARATPKADLPLPSEMPAPEPPEIYPNVALWHPEAGDSFSNYDEYAAWYESYRPRSPAPRPAVGVVVFRQYVTGGTFEHYRAAIRALEARGLGVVAGFGGMDNRALVELFRPAAIRLLVNLTGFNLVGSMGRPQPDDAVKLLRELDIPYLVPFPLLFQTEAEWRQDPIGLAPMQTALQVVLPELEGATEPRVFGSKGPDDDFVPVAEHVERLARRVGRWVDLATKPAHEKRVALTIFSFPPDKGSVGSAAYLDVFQSVYGLMEKLKAEGYDVDVPATAAALRQLVLGGDQALPGAPSVHVHDTLPLDTYRRLVPDYRRIEANFGPAPGLIDSDGKGLHIRGRAFGNVFVGVQPGFGYEGDPMRLLFAKDATPSHSFAAYYAWLNHVWRADALVHVGTHGALEFMPGKQVGLTPGCWPEQLVGDLPHVYFYSMNNPSEATIAKRRSGGTMVTYLSPPLREAGLYNTLLSLNEALASYRETAAAVAVPPGASSASAASDAVGDGLTPSQHAAFTSIRALAEQANLDEEVPPPPRQEADLSAADADDYVFRLAAYVQTLAERLIPVGLHVAGRPVADDEAAEFLWAALQHARPERKVPSLPDLLAEARGLTWDELQPGDARRDEIVEEGRGIVQAFVKDGGDDNFPAGAEPVAEFARDFLQRLRQERELDAVVSSLAGGYVPPAPGGDPARVPEALPTGRNLHALDPQRIPSPGARQRAKPVVDALLRRIVEEQGGWPETIAFVLWGTDNIKTEGEGVAQVLELIGVEPVPDSLGRMTRLRLIPAEELGRPRIDVVLSASGIFRDIFPNVMELLDRAIQMAAAAKEEESQNYIRKHAAAIAQRLDIPFEQAARRVFSNAPGAYGTGVNDVVEASTWETGDDLAHVFAERKSFAFGEGGPIHSPELLEACLSTCSAAFQNLDSTEIGLADVDHYYEYLGGLASVTKSVRGEALKAYVADTVAPQTAVRSLEETLRLETRTRLLNPRWYEGMLEHGYQGVHEIATRLDNTFGWSATADAVDGWIYTDVADTFVLDDEMRRRLEEHNPRALLRLAGRLAEAHDRGFWDADEERLQKLRDVLMETEDFLEGVV